MEKVTLATLIARKQQGQPIAMLTCYDYSTAILAQKAGLDALLVGDSASQVILGHNSTLPISMDIMVELAAAVRRGAPDLYLVGDMPFLSYQVSMEAAIQNAGRFMVQAGCDAVKLEVDDRHVDIVAKLSAAGIPVVAHLGHRPQAAQQSCKIVQTRTAEKAQQILAQARQMVQAGACMILLECVTAPVASIITAQLNVPVIGCGSGANCDGQVLVLHDILGLTNGPSPRFNKQYAQIGTQIQNAMANYADEVHKRTFPDDQHSYHMPSAQQESFNRWLKQLNIDKNKHKANP